MVEALAKDVYLDESVIITALARGILNSSSSAEHVLSEALPAMTWAETSIFPYRSQEEKEWIGEYWRSCVATMMQRMLSHQQPDIAIELGIRGLSWEDVMEAVQKRIYEDARIRVYKWTEKVLDWIDDKPSDYLEYNLVRLQKEMKQSATG